MWILTVCTWGIFGICSQLNSYDMPSQQDCSAEREALIKMKGEDHYQYITCTPHGEKGK
jgi:hypothetical protein